MKLLLDIKGSKALFIMKLLKNFKFVKASPLIPEKTEILEGIKTAVEEMKLINEGRLKGTLAKELIHEL